MDKEVKFLIICIILSLFCITAVSAADNSTDVAVNESSEADVEIPETPNIAIMQQAFIQAMTLE